MKRKEHIYKITFIFLLLSSYIVTCQIKPIRDFDEYLMIDDFGDIYSGTNNNSTNSGESELDDFSFSWGSGFNTAFNNLANLEIARQRAYRAWYSKQLNLMKDEIERQLNTSFGNYDQAKNAYFSHIESRNVNKNKPPIRSKYRDLRNSGYSKNSNYLRELKTLQIRDAEIRAGNINNSQFPFLEVNGVPLKDITSLSAISQFRKNIENAFEDNTWRTHEYKYIVEKLDYLGSGFDNEMLRLKHNYYNNFSDWDRLGLMQFLLNYETYKDLINCYVCVLPNELAKFRNSDMATQPVIEEYAKNNRGGGVSLFDPRYPQIHRFKYQNNFCGGAIDYLAWEADKQAALDELVNNTSTAEFKFRNFVNELDLDINDYTADYRNHTLSYDELNLIQQKTEFIYSKINTINKESINQLSFADQQLVVQDILFVTMFPWIKDLASQLPSSAEEWKVFFEIMKPILVEIGIEFVPFGGVYNSAVDTLNGINSGDATAIVLGVVGIIIEFTPFDQIKNFIQLVRYSKKGVKIFKLTRKFTGVIRTALDSGLKIVLDNNVVKFLNNSGSEVARIVNNVMTFKYNGFGGNIVTYQHKTTTVIGKWQNQIENIWNTGLAKQGANNGGMNILGNVPNGTILEKWNFNKQWLNNAIARGDAIRVTANPLDINNVFNTLSGINPSAFSSINNLKSYLLSLSPDKVNQLGFYGREIRHLFQNGYFFNSATNQFIK